MISHKKKSIEKLDDHILRKYQIIEKIGKGAYGVCFSAIFKKTGAKVVIKKVFDAFTNATDAQRTYREVMILSVLKHENVVTLHKVFKANNNIDLYLIFEFVESDLHQVVKSKILKEVHKQWILFQLLKTLDYLHSAKIIHRDLKPSNVFINSNCSLKLGDFGLARTLTDKKNVNDEQPVVTDYVATRWYRAPEMLLGSRYYSKKADMFSIGCIFAEMMNSKVLFQGSSTTNQLKKILQVTGKIKRSKIHHLKSKYAEDMLDKIRIEERKKKSLRQLFPKEKDEALDLLEKMLKFDPEERISTKEAMQHKYLSIFNHSKKKRKSKKRVRGIKLALNDCKKYSIDEYRRRLYKFMRNKGVVRVRKTKRKRPKKETSTTSTAPSLKESKKESSNSVSTEMNENLAKNEKKTTKMPQIVKRNVNSFKTSIV